MSSGMITKQQLMTFFAKIEAYLASPEAIQRGKDAVAKGTKACCDLIWCGRVTVFQGEDVTEEFQREIFESINIGE